MAIANRIPNTIIATKLDVIIRSFMWRGDLQPLGTWLVPMKGEKLPPTVLCGFGYRDA